MQNGLLNDNGHGIFLNHQTIRMCALIYNFLLSLQFLLFQYFQFQKSLLITPSINAFLFLIILHKFGIHFIDGVICQMNVHITDV
jgi:hypothetical protein